MVIVELVENKEARMDVSTYMTNLLAPADENGSSEIITTSDISKAYRYDNEEQARESVSFMTGITSDAALNRFIEQSVEFIEETEEVGKNGISSND